MSYSKRPILFYDGDCGLCDWAVQFTMVRTADDALDFAPLQGSTAEKYLSEKLRTDLSTVVLMEDDQIYTHSSAVLKILGKIGGAWGLLQVFWILPRFIRDAGYRFVASIRRKVWPMNESCILPNSEQQKRFLP